MFTTYIIYSKSIDQFYTGYTAGLLTDRLRRHNSNQKGFTGRTNDWEIVFSKQFTTKSEAINFEKKIKSWKSKEKIKELIKTEN